MYLVIMTKKEMKLNILYLLCNMYKYSDDYIIPLYIAWSDDGFQNNSIIKCY